MDSSDSNISFDSDGVCDHCNTFDVKIKPHWKIDSNSKAKLFKLVNKIKKSGKNQDFDCLMGMSVY